MNAFKQALELKQVDEIDWETTQNLTYEGRDQDFTVKKGFKTDLASVPKLFQSLFGRSGSYARAAVLHDLLWRISRKYWGDRDMPSAKRIRIQGKSYPASYLIDPVDVDGLFRRSMRLSGTSFVVRWIMWWAVRTAAIFTGFKGDMQRRDWLQYVGVSLGVFSPLIAGAAALIYTLFGG
jgi:hypothetical protein